MTKFFRTKPSELALKPELRIYRIRYVVLPSNQIINVCGPHRMPPNLSGKQRELREISNQRYIDGMNKKNGFYTKLEASILKDGIRNPILVQAGYCMPKWHQYLPQDIVDNPEKILVCNTHGGSRLYIAQKHNLEIPCLVNDFLDVFPYEKTLEYTEEILECFTDKPVGIMFGDKGISISSLPQVHL